MVEIKVNQPIVRTERTGDYTKFSGKTTAKDFKGWLEGKISLFARKDNTEMLFIFQEVLRAYNHYNPEKKVQVEVEGWHGKSSFEIIKELDKLVIIKFQKPDKDSEPKEIRIEIPKEEIIAMIGSIKELEVSSEWIETKDLALRFSNKLGIYHSGWKTGDNPIFSDRKFHNRLTLLLDALDKMELIKYSGGKTKILEKDLSIQLVL